MSLCFQPARFALLARLLTLHFCKSAAWCFLAEAAFGVRRRASLPASIPTNFSAKKPTSLFLRRESFLNFQPSARPGGCAFIATIWSGIHLAEALFWEAFNVAARRSLINFLSKFIAIDNSAPCKRIWQILCAQNALQGLFYLATQLYLEIYFSYTFFATAMMRKNLGWNLTR
jgi:hypothetical protein